MPTGSPQCQGAILLPLDAVQQVQHTITPLDMIERIFPPIGFLIFFRVEAPDTQYHLHT
jgi:hypothetical protein